MFVIDGRQHVLPKIFITRKCINPHHYLKYPVIALSSIQLIFPISSMKKIYTYYGKGRPRRCDSISTRIFTNLKSHQSNKVIVLPSERPNFVTSKVDQSFLQWVLQLPARHMVEKKLNFAGTYCSGLILLSPERCKDSIRHINANNPFACTISNQKIF